MTVTVDPTGAGVQFTLHLKDCADGDRQKVRIRSAALSDGLTAVELAYARERSQTVSTRSIADVILDVR
jgi:hypothetical protein